MKKTIMIIGFLLLLMFTSVASSETFGNDISGAGGTTIENNVKGSVFTCSNNGVLNNITVHLVINANHNVTCGIYNNDTGVFLGYTEKRLLAPGGSPYTFDNVSTINLIGGTDYLLVAWAEADVGICSIATELNTPGNFTYGDAEVYNHPNFPQPFAYNVAKNGETACIYASYTVSGEDFVRFSRGYIAGVIGMLFGLLFGIIFVFVNPIKNKRR